LHQLLKGWLTLISCRDGPINDALKQRLANMDEIFATGGNWHSANEYKKLMGRQHLAAVDPCCVACKQLLRLLAAWS
jgi:hypothetical protein